MLKEQEHLSCEERLRKQGLFHMEKRQLWGELTAACLYLQGGQQGVRLTTVVCHDRTRNDKHKLKQGKSRLDRR